MTDPQIPASKPAAILPAQTQGSAVSATAPARLQIANAAVRQAPPALQNPPQPIHVEGRVVSSNPQGHELRIATPDGEITVQSNANLPPETPVSVDLSMQKGQEVATITVIRQQAQAAQELEDIAPAPQQQPPLQPGDAVQAIFIPEPEEAAPPPMAPPPETALPPGDLAQIAQVIENFPVSQLPKLPGPLPLPADVLFQVATSPNVLAALQRLPAQQQAQLSTYLERPDVVQALKKILPGVVRSLQSLRPALQVVPPATAPEEEPLDDNVMNIVRSQTDARMAQETAPSGASPGVSGNSAPPMLAALKGFLPLLESLQLQDAPFSTMTQGPTGSPLSGLMPKSMYEVRVASITAPGGTPPVPLAGELQGEVESVSPRGFPVVRSGGDLFVLKTLASVPRGSIVTFRAIPLTAEQALASGKPLDEAGWFHPLLSDSWPALQEALQAISGAAPNLAQALRDTIPAATPRLVPTALFFLAALRVGSVESWLGEPVLQTLRQAGKSNLIDRLTSDFGKLATQAKETVSGDWRAISMPLRHDDSISQLQFFVRQQRDDKEDTKDDGASRPITRFVLNLRLSRLGDMQLDGLLHQKRFDLILRSAERLTPDMRQDLLQGFQRGLDQAGMVGSIGFHTKAESWINIALPHQGMTA